MSSDDAGTAGIPPKSYPHPFPPPPAGEGTAGVGGAPPPPPAGGGGGGGGVGEAPPPRGGGGGGGGGITVPASQEMSAAPIGPASALANAKRLIVKIGSALLVQENGEIRRTWLDLLVADV